MKPHRIGYILLILFFPLRLFAQNTYPNYCGILQKAIEQKELSVLVDTNTILVDTTGKFAKCSLSFKGRPLKITREWLKAYDANNNDTVRNFGMPIKYKNIIIIRIEKQSEKYMSLSFMRPFTQDKVDMEISRINKKQIYIYDVSAGKYFFESE